MGDPGADRGSQRRTAGDVRPRNRDAAADAPARDREGADGPGSNERVPGPGAWPRRHQAPGIDRRPWKMARRHPAASGICTNYTERRRLLRHRVILSPQAKDPSPRGTDPSFVRMTPEEEHTMAQTTNGQ